MHHMVQIRPFGRNDGQFLLQSCGGPPRSSKYLDFRAKSIQSDRCWGPDGAMRDDPQATAALNCGIFVTNGDR